MQTRLRLPMQNRSQNTTNRSYGTAIHKPLLWATHKISHGEMPLRPKCRPDGAEWVAGTRRCGYQNVAPMGLNVLVGRGVSTGVFEPKRGDSLVGQLQNPRTEPQRGDIFIRTKRSCKPDWAFRCKTDPQTPQIVPTEREYMNRLRRLPTKSPSGRCCFGQNVAPMGS